jgi:hypothetical protein
MDNNSIRIDMYLLSEMSVADALVFETELKTNIELQKEFTIQKQIIEAAKNVGIKNEFSKAIKNNIIKRNIIKGGTIVILVATLAFLAYNSNLFDHKNAKGNNETSINKPIAETFTINNANDTIIETKDGVVFAIPANAFSGKNNIELQIKTALTPYDIMQNGLSTLSNGALLQTAGMFYIKGFENGKEVPLTKEILVSVPTKKINPAMQLFDGVEDSTGRINWVNPKPIENKLRTYDITTLDFYPPNYIPTLKALNKRYQNKKYTDSLYYSFSGYQSLTTMPLAPEESIEDFFQIKDSISKEDGGIIEPQQKLKEETIYQHYEIDPSKIRAIWNKKFNNTILATIEFEERLHFLHTLCDPIYLKGYLEAIDKPLYKIDQLFANYATGETKKKFLEFAARKDGGVAIAIGLQQKLSTYFQQKSKAYREATEKTWAKYQKELEALNNIAYAKQYEAALRNIKRENQNFDEELCANITEAYSQIGIKRNCRDTPPPPPAEKYYTVPITNTGWKNLDMYVVDATENRQSMTYKDPTTGKIAQLKYEGINIKIENETQFDRVIVYLIPNGLSSFQKVEKNENSYKENLNSIFKYDAVVLAYKDEQAYFISESNVSPKEYTFTLIAQSNEQVINTFKKYSIDKATEIKTEFEYQLFKQKETLRQIQLKKYMEFREKVGRSIFSCYENQLDTTIEKSITK